MPIPDNVASHSRTFSHDFPGDYNLVGRRNPIRRDEECDRQRKHDTRFFGLNF